MNTQIICPTCKSTIDLDEVLTSNLESAIREQYEAKNKSMAADFAKRNEELSRQQAEFEEKKKRENEIFIDRVKKESEILAKKREEDLLARLKEENRTKLEFLENENKEKEQKLKQMQEMELQMLKLGQQLKAQQEEESFKLQKQRIDLENELREKLSNDILLKLQEKYDLEKREFEKKLNDQNKLIDQMQRKMQQGSMQTQGEILELALEEILSSTFPYDELHEVGKGKRGADCILIVRNESGMECGRIIFESKRTKEYKKEWLSKLREDAIDAKCDICILVTQVVPDDIKLFDQRDGVWICRFAEVTQLVKVIREGIINVARARRSQENKGEKKEMLYNYFTGNEFLQQMRAINEAYLFLKSSVDKERMQMEKIWKEREKQIDKVLLNNSYLLGTIKGIAGNDIDDAQLEN